MDIIEAVLSYPEKGKRFKSKLGRGGVKKDKPTIVNPSREDGGLEGYLFNLGAAVVVSP